VRVQDFHALKALVVQERHLFQEAPGVSLAPLACVGWCGVIAQADSAIPHGHDGRF